MESPAMTAMMAMPTGMESPTGVESAAKISPLPGTRPFLNLASHFSPILPGFSLPGFSLAGLSLPGSLPIVSLYILIPFITITISSVCLSVFLLTSESSLSDGRHYLHAHLHSKTLIHHGGYDDLSHRCNTSVFSPLSSDVLAAGHKLYNSKRCLQLEYGSGSDHCTTLAVSGSAAIDICTEMGTGVDCYQAALAAEKIALSCGARREVVSGGTVCFKKVLDVRVVVRHVNGPGQV